MAARQILVVTDNERVLHVIRLALGDEYELLAHMFAPPNGHKQSVAAGDWDLIVLALSAFDSEPLVAVAHACLAPWLGRIPLLVISDRPFPRDDFTRILHLEFPFTEDQLAQCVRDILSKPPAIEPHCQSNR